MADECTPFTRDGFVFPRRPANRPALPRIGYRIGRYPEFVEFLARRIDSAVELEAWSHRSADDPGIALLEGAAIVGDILTFYQERYANEAFLRTATWRESVADLVRLLGYRLAPGLGGRATFAFEVKGKAAVTVPAEFPLKADLADVPDPVDFQTASTLVAWPQLSRFRLYRGRQYDAALAQDEARFEIDGAGDDCSQAGIAALGLAAGDRLMLLPAEPGWTASGSDLAVEQAAPQVLRVKQVTAALGRTQIEFETPLARTWTSPVTLYRLGRSWRHFGHAAPRTYLANHAGAGGLIDGASEEDTGYERHVDGSHYCSNTSSTLNLPGELLPLDQEVNDACANSQVVVQTLVRNGSTVRALAALKTVRATRSATLGFATVNGATTMLTLDSALIRHGALPDAVSDVRDYQVHEVTSAAIRLRPKAAPKTAAFTAGGDALDFFGTLAEVKPIAGRRLVLQHDDGRLIERTCTNEVEDFVLSAGTVDEPRMWTLSLDEAPLPFTRDDFDEVTPRVTVFGNLAEATQGRAEAEVALGNGDARARFQTFRLPKSPLTYLLHAGATPPQVPELAVHVNGRLWQRVDSLFGQAPEAEVYVVREDAEGASYVQFGDGRTGSRLPSGLGNVTARYRSGSGAYGPLKPGAKPSAGRKIEGLDKVQLPGVVGGGGPRESADKAREAAPGRLQSLGRLVSLRDFETETLAIPGVNAAVAAWGMTDGVPTLVLTVLLEAGREQEFEAVRATIQGYQRCRGPDRFPVRVEQAFLRYVYLDLVCAHDPRLQSADVDTRVRAALGLVGDDAAARHGIFGLRARRLGAPEYASRIEGRVQATEGVTWCRVASLGLFGSAASPGDLALPPAPRALAGQLVPAGNELLQLHPDHLTLTHAAADAAEECT